MILSVSLARIKFVNASIALCKISCSFFTNFAFAKSKAVIFFWRVISLPKSKIVCSNFIEVVNGSTSLIVASPPLWLVSLFVSSILLDPLNVNEGL